MATPETSRPHRGDRARESADGDALAVEAANGATGLLIVDMISCWDFPDADKLLPVAAQVAPRIAALKRRCGQRGVPVIYANDNRGRWRSDFGALVELSVSCGGTGAAITSALMPRHEDYFVLKPQQSAFVATPLEQLLEVLGVHRLLVTGVASDQCVLSTATDARMRGLEVVLPRDCTGTQTARRHAMLMEQCGVVFGIATTPGSHIRLPAPTGAARHD
jgi:nicotinamidase-related amidase